MNSETSIKQKKKKRKKRKENTQIQRTLFPQTLSQISFPQIAQKFATLIFSIPFSFLLYKILF